MIGVNTPEVFGEAQYYGREASNFSKKRLENQTVYLFRDVSDTDKYGRLLRYLFIQNDPIMFNETLLIEGYANTMTIPPDVMFSKKFAKLERESRENSKGLWKENKNSSSNQANCNNPKIKGNINSKNEKIYHMPNGRYYDQTKAEEIFCTEEEAIAAGYRKSKQ
jgi:micrococcal nuclease